MDNHTEQPREEEKTTENTTPEKLQVARTGNRLHLPLVVILLVVVVCVGYNIIQIRELHRTIDSIQARQVALEGSMEERIRILKSTVSVMDSKLISMARSLAEVYERQPLDSEDWALAEVEYLLIIASQRLLLEKDVNTALAAMHSAESRLAGLRNPDLIPVREQLVADINQLEAVNSVDISGLAIYLGDIIDRSAGLPLKKPESLVMDAEADRGKGSDTAPAQTSDIKSAFKRIWGELKSLVVIRKGAEHRYEFLMPEQSYFLKQNLRLELENARMSVLQRDTENLHTSITLISDWLTTYYDISDASVANILDTLDTIAGMELDPPIPEISSSLETLRAYRKQ